MSAPASNSKRDSRACAGRGQESQRESAIAVDHRTTVVGRSKKPTDRKKKRIEANCGAGSLALASVGGTVATGRSLLFAEHRDVEASENRSGPVGETALQRSKD